MVTGPTSRNCKWSDYAKKDCPAYIGAFEKAYWHQGGEPASENVTDAIR